MSLKQDEDTERIEQQQTERKKVSAAVRKIAKDNMQYLKGRCQALNRLSHKLYLEKVRATHNVAIMKKEAAKFRMQKETVDLDRAIMISKIFNLNSENDRLNELVFKLNVSQSNTDIDQALMLKELQAKCMAQSLNVIDLEKHCDQKDQFLEKKDELLTEIIKVVGVEREKLSKGLFRFRKFRRSRPLKREEKDLNDFDKKADMDLIWQLTQAATNQVGLEKIKRNKLIDELEDKDKLRELEVGRLTVENSQLKDKVLRLQSDNSRLKRGDFDTNSITADNMTFDRVQELVHSYNALKVTNSSHVNQLKKVETTLIRQLKNFAEKEDLVKNLEKEFEAVSAKYDEMKERMENAINSTVNSKTIQYEALVKDMGGQVSKLLYENTKLRKYIEVKLGQVILPLHLELVSKEYLQPRDFELFENIEGLIAQNTELKSSQYQMASSSVSESHKPKEAVDAELKNLMKRVEAADREKEKLEVSLREWKSKAKAIIEQSADVHRQLNNYQHEYAILDQKHKNSEQQVERLKKELSRIDSTKVASNLLIES